MNVLVTTLGSHGDVHPFLGIALALKARGHSVKVIASAYFESLVRATGLDIVPLGKPEDFEAIARDPKVWHWFHGFARIGESIGASIQPCYQAVLDHAVPGRTVLVYSTLAFGARIAQETLKLPGVSVHLSPSIFQSTHAPPKLNGIVLPAWLGRRARRWVLGAADWLVLDRIFGAPVNAFRKQLALKPVRGVLSRWCHSPQRVIGLWPEWYAPPQPDWPRQTMLTGFPLFDEKEVTPLSPEVEKFLNSGTRPVAFTPGSANFHGHEFFAAAVKACRRMGRRGLLLTRHAEQIPATLPPGILHVPYAPFSQLLPQCAALVHHGGIGTTGQGLSCGVPQLVVPMSFDQPDNAERVRRLGVGEWLRPRRFTGPNAAEVLAGLTQSPAVAKACRDIAARFNATDPLSRTAELIEQLSNK